jgi:2-methylcitrate dehydratase PrpD
MGIAEYHGPRSQMMRCIDFPTMTKDGAYGAMTGVSAVYLAQDGFTGAPALTIEQDDIQPDIWADLGDNWLVTQQYFKPYPVCRWAQAPIEGVLALRRAHNLTAADVENLSVETFHESCRLATRFPKTPEEAQYSTSFPAAVALVHGDVAPHHLVDDALNDSEVLRLSGAMDFTENDQANEAFPIRRYARTTLTLRDGRELQSDWMEPIWDLK